MFPVDLLHTLTRMWLSDHHRQTIAFAKRGEAVLERLSILAVLRNLIQRSSERRDDRVTPALRLGLTDRPWGWGDVLAERRFPTRIRLSRSTARVFGRTMRDPRGIRWPRHVRMRALRRPDVRASGSDETGRAPTRRMHRQCALRTGSRRGSSPAFAPRWNRSISADVQERTGRNPRTERAPGGRPPGARSGRSVSGQLRPNETTASVPPSCAPVPDVVACGRLPLP